MTYNLTNLTTGGANTTFLSFTKDVSTNILGGNMVGTLILIMVFAVFFFVVKSRGYYTSTSLAVACWMVSLSVLLMRPMGLIDDWVWWIGLILTPIAIFILFMASATE